MVKQQSRQWAISISYLLPKILGCMYERSHVNSSKAPCIISLRRNGLEVPAVRHHIYLVGAVMTAVFGRVYKLSLICIEDENAGM